MNIEKLIRENIGTVLDVRTSKEFSEGNFAGSINIPLKEIPERINELKSMKAPLILCCASGARSGQAHRFLEQSGIECCNAGSWLNVNYFQTQTV
jgi:rhodanese-related sulfurtransferase